MFSKLKNSSFYLASILFLCSCSESKGTYPPSPPDYRERAASAYCKKVGQEFAIKHKLFFNGGSERINMADFTKGIDLSYQIFRQLSKDEARALIVDCIQMLIREFNENEEIKPFIPGGKYELRNFHVVIFIDPERKTVYFPNLGKVSFSHGKIEYETYDPDKNYIRTKTSEKETLKEALAQLNDGSLKDIKMP